MDPWSPEWFLRPEQSGSPICGTLGLSADDLPPAAKGRAAERVPLEIGAGLRQRGAHGVSVQILDLSTHGFRAATHLDLNAGADVWLRLPGIEAFQAKVVWAKGYVIGCAFERPLHPAVLEMIVSKTPGR